MMRILAAAFAGALLFSAGAEAQDCSLDELASLAITTLPSGAVAAPFKVNGDSVLLAVAMQAPHTALNADYIASKHMDASASGMALWEFDVGTYRFNHMTVGEVPTSEPGTAGVLGMDTLHDYDVEFDFKNAKMVLFARQHCSGNVVYWAKSYTVVPFSIDANGHVLAQMTLDGKPATVEISTAPGHLAMRAPGAVKTLGIGAITINDPQVVAAGDIAPGAQARVGLDELKKLHLFFAFSENKLYVTAAGAH